LCLRYWQHAGNRANDTRYRTDTPSNSACDAPQATKEFIAVSGIHGVRNRVLHGIVVVALVNISGIDAIYVIVCVALVKLVRGVQLVDRIRILESLTPAAAATQQTAGDAPQSADQAPEEFIVTFISFVVFIPLVGFVSGVVVVHRACGSLRSVSHQIVHYIGVKTVHDALLVTRVSVGLLSV